MNLKERANRLKIDIPAIFIAIRKKETPLAAKMIASIAIIYALSPIDLIPDFIPVLGYLDDIVILPGLIALTVRLIPPDLLEECRIHAKEIWVDGTPKKWYFSLPIVAIWIFVIDIIIKVIWG